jgi:methanogenic corrinoid protein MtbC1
MPGTQATHLIAQLQAEEAGKGRELDAGLSEKTPLEISGLIEGEIIPRLLCAHRGEGRQDAQASEDRIDAAQAEGFAPMVLRLEAHALMDQIEGFIARGASVEAVLIDLLAPAARQLGVWWEEDSCDFVDVTMGLWRLQQVVYELSARLPGKAPVAERDKRALFSVIPGGQHSFGTVLIEECFRREGWMTTCLTSTTEQQLARLVGEHHFDIVGLTISHDDEITGAGALIATLRTKSRNPMLGVMVGGRVLVNSPELALQIGADATAADAVRAIARADYLLRSLDEQAVNRC